MLNNSILRRNLPRLSPLAPWLENYSIVLSSGKTAANRIYVGVIKHYKDSKSFAICKLFAKKIAEDFIQKLAKLSGEKAGIS